MSIQCRGGGPAGALVWSHDTRKRREQHGVHRHFIIVIITLNHKTRSQYLCILIVQVLLLAVLRVSVVLLARVKCIHHNLFRALDLCPAERTSLQKKNEINCLARVLLGTPFSPLHSPVPPNLPARRLDRECTTNGRRALSECPCRSPHRFCTAGRCFLETRIGDRLESAFQSIPSTPTHPFRSRVRTAPV